MDYGDFCIILMMALIWVLAGIFTCLLFNWGMELAIAIAAVGFLCTIITLLL